MACYKYYLCNFAVWTYYYKQFVRTNNKKLSLCHIKSIGVVPTTK